jgi:hypothetical protein
MNAYLFNNAIDTQTWKTSDQEMRFFSGYGAADTASDTNSHPNQLDYQP